MLIKLSNILKSVVYRYIEFPLLKPGLIIFLAGILNFGDRTASILSQYLMLQGKHVTQASS